VALGGATELGKRAEIKNLNSFKSVEKAAEYELKRQVELLEKGETVVQETRGWEDAKQKTFSQRSKEDAQDYRYMPDADIPPIVLGDDEIAEIQADMPNLPDYYRQSFSGLGLDSTAENALLLSKNTAELFDRICKKSSGKIAKRIAFWLLKSIVENSDENALDQSEVLSVSDEYLIELSEMVENNKLNSNAGDIIFKEMQKSSSSPLVIAEEMNLLQVSDENELGIIVDGVLANAANTQSVADFKAGKDKAIGFLVGQVMRESKGKANPALAQKLIRERIK
jgi:aspartyl-tRNA(Asn)/glutamyl-tRNA(Gln) amidotransferase subunit B